MAQHVAGIVLAQRREVSEHASVRQHHLQPGDEIAHRPVADDAGAAGIGRDQPADLGAALAAEMQRELPPGLGRGIVQIAEHDAGIDGRDAGRAVDRTDAVHAT
jgi:hypothetical protein